MHWFIRVNSFLNQTRTSGGVRLFDSALKLMRASPGVRQSTLPLGFVCDMFNQGTSSNTGIVLRVSHTLSPDLA